MRLSFPRSIISDCFQVERTALLCSEHLFSEEPLSFHAKRFPVALSASFLRSGGIQSLFAVYCYFLSAYFGFGLFSFFKPDLYLSFLRMLFALLLCAIWANQKQKGRIFFSCVCSFPCTLV